MLAVSAEVELFFGLNIKCIKAGFAMSCKALTRFANVSKHVMTKPNITGKIFAKSAKHAAARIVYVKYYSIAT